MDFQSFGPSGSKPIILTPAGESASLLRPITIPKSCKFVYALLIGPGGNGGAGFSRTAGTAGGGGGGGGSGGTARMLCPASIFNGQMYVRIGPSNGVATGIWLTADAAAAAAASSLAVGGAGGVGGAGLVGAGGTAGTAGGTGSINFPAIAIATGGAAGALGGAQTGAIGATATSAAFPTTMPGAGGAGCTTTDFAGGPVTLTGAPIVTLAGGLAAGGKGNDGWIVGPYMQGLGGSGGGSNNSGTGGAGGAGAIGCGGGGGGAGVTGGAGGRGGDGQIMVWWL